MLSLPKEHNLGIPDKVIPGKSALAAIGGLYAPISGHC